ncbi:tetratricopeptide repeat protein, partial [Rheinheimera muenzenbergensis]
MPDQTPADIWPEMRLHIEWSERFSLCFLFCPDSKAIEDIVQWLDDSSAMRTAPLSRFVPDSPRTAVAEVLTKLEEHSNRIAKYHAPVWLQILTLDNENDTSQWDAARAALLARLNERREWLSNNFACPLVICLPLHWQTKVIQIAPDLWHIRSYSSAVEAKLAVQQQEQYPDLLPHFLQSQPDTDNAAFIAKVELARKKLQQKPDAVSLQRELLMAISELGDAERDTGRAESALSAYRESLAMSRQLQAQLGDQPQVLLDLSVSLSKLGDAERDTGRAEAALSAYRESLSIDRQLQAQLGDQPQVLLDLSVSLSKLG